MLPCATKLMYETLAFWGHTTWNMLLILKESVDLSCYHVLMHIFLIMNTCLTFLLISSTFVSLLIKKIDQNLKMSGQGTTFFISFKARGGVRGQKTNLAYIKVQLVIELLLFTELQNLCLWQKYGLSKFGGVAHSHTKYRGIKWPKTAILDQNSKVLVS